MRIFFIGNTRFKKVNIIRFYSKLDNASRTLKNNLFSQES